MSLELLLQEQKKNSQASPTLVLQIWISDPIQINVLFLFFFLFFLFWPPQTPLSALEVVREREFLASVAR